MPQCHLLRCVGGDFSDDGYLYLLDLILNSTSSLFYILQVVNNVKVARSSSYSPIFQVTFVLQERALSSTRRLNDVSV